MIIYINQKVEIQTLCRLRSIAETFNVELIPRAQNETFALTMADENSFEALNRLDAIRSIHKGIEKLIDFQTV